MTASPDPSLIEAAKRKAAFKAVEDHFDSGMSHVGIGSGSTIQYGVDAIRAHLEAHPPKPGHHIRFVPTGSQSKKVIEGASLTAVTFDSLAQDTVLDVAFDGADEVDSELNCIKGGGACLFQEKLVATRARKFVCIADYRKDQARLLSEWKSIPIEVVPLAQARVLRELKALGAIEPKVRFTGSSTDASPIRTDQGFYIVDAPFKTLLTDADVEAGKDGSGKDGVWHVATLAAKIKAITGVLEVGLFFGLDGIDAQKAGAQGGQKPIAVYFGTKDGQVTVRHRVGKE